MDECEITVVIASLVPVVLLVFSICAKYIPCCNAYFKGVRYPVENSVEEDGQAD